MMRPVNALRRAMQRFNADEAPNVFSARQVTITENFAPYVFDGSDVPSRWWREFRQHATAAKLRRLRAVFGGAQDYERTGDTAFFTLPTRWSGATESRRFVENGGWAFVLVRESHGWRIRSYAWAVTSFDLIN